MERRMGEWEKRVQRLEEKVEKREKRCEGQESGRDESPVKRGGKGEKDREQRGGEKDMRGVMGKEKEKEGTEADSGNNWDSRKGVEEERRG